MYKFGDAVIHPSPCIKIIGVNVDQHLYLQSHVDLIVRRCYATLGVLSKVAHKLPQSVKKIIVEMYSLTSYIA